MYPFSLVFISLFFAIQAISLGHCLRFAHKIIANYWWLQLSVGSAIMAVYFAVVGHIGLIGKEYATFHIIFLSLALPYYIKKKWKCFSVRKLKKDILKSGLKIIKVQTTRYKLAIVAWMEKV